MSIMRTVLGSSLARGLALIVLLGGTAQAGGPTIYRYQVSGTRVATNTAVEGSLDFYSNGTFVGGLSPSSPLGVFNFGGGYTELNLLFISFWSFSSNPVAGLPPDTGSGIKLFFGLFIVGTLEESLSGEFSIAGIFDEILTLPRPPLDDVPSWVASRTRTTLFATPFRRLSFAVERS